MQDSIRPYGPGKFSTILDSYVYGVTLNGGCDDELGDVGGFGWFGLMRNGRTIFQDHDPSLETLNSAEQDQLTSCAGVIVSEDSQGFVHVEYFDTDEHLTKRWEVLCKQAQQFEDESNDGQDDEIPGDFAF